MIDITPSRLVTPANNSVDLDTLLSIIGTKDANAIWYDYKLASDIAGNVIVHSQNGVDRPGINVDLEPGKTYYIFERAKNNTSTGSWSGGNKITTKALTTTGIADIILGDDLLIYPNPTTQDITVEYYLLRQSKINVCLYNLDGKELIGQEFEDPPGSQSHRINLKSIGKGIFILKIETLCDGKSRHLKALKIIKN
jgi:hypothetical protein